MESLAALGPDDVEMLVCGSRGYGPVRRVLLGGVSSRLIRRAQTAGNCGAAGLHRVTRSSRRFGWIARWARGAPSCQATADPPPPSTAACTNPVARTVSRPSRLPPEAIARRTKGHDVRPRAGIRLRSAPGDPHGGAVKPKMPETRGAHNPKSGADSTRAFGRPTVGITRQVTATKVPERGVEHRLPTPCQPVTPCPSKAALTRRCTALSPYFVTPCLTPDYPAGALLGNGLRRKGAIPRDQTA